MTSTTHLHEVDNKQLVHLSQHLPGTLIITGEDGLDFGQAVTVVSASARTDLALRRSPDSVTIPIEAVRDLREQVRGRFDTETVVAIYEADTMTIPAQNAFLKLLEEPGNHLHFVLTTADPSGILATVHSRAEHVALHRTTREQSEQLLDELGMQDKTTRTQLLFMAEGLPAELAHLAGDADYFATRSQLMRDSRELLSGSLYGKLKLAQKYKDNRPGALVLTAYALSLVERTLHEKPDGQLVIKLYHLMTAQERLAGNGNIRLVLGDLVVK